jgi:polar amino acid transport system substrate-binding protein
MRLLTLLCGFCLLNFTASQTLAQAPASKVRVVTRNLEPFSFEKDGRRVGYAAELWDQLARERSWITKFRWSIARRKSLMR